MAAAKQKSNLNKSDLQALARANDVEFTDKTTNVELEDALEAKGVKLDSADTPAPGEDVMLTGTPASPSGTRVADATVAAEAGEPESSSGVFDDEEILDAAPTDVSTEDLVRAKAVIDRLLTERGTDVPAEQPQTMLERAKDVPIFRGEHDLTLEKAAAMKLDPPLERDPLGFHIRQAADSHTGLAYGEKYVVVIDVEGGKHAAKL